MDIKRVNEVRKVEADEANRMTREELYEELHKLLERAPVEKGKAVAYIEMDEAVLNHLYDFGIKHDMLLCEAIEIAIKAFLNFADPQ